MERILIIKLSAFGDIVQALGAIHDISSHHRDAKVILMTTPPFAGILRKCPWVDDVVADPRDPRWRLDRMWLLGRRLQQLDVSAVYDLQQVGRTAFYHRWLLRGKPWRVGGRERQHRIGGTDLAGRGAMERFAVQLAAAGIPVVHTLQPDPGWMVEDVTALLAKKNVTSPYVVLLPGSSAAHPAKRWPHYNSLARWFRERGRKVVTVPGPDELELCRSISGAAMLTEGNPFLTLFELAGVLHGAEFVVGNDTGPTHLAAHLGRPGLALFCSSHFRPERTGIQFSGFAWLEAESLEGLSFEKVRDRVAALLLNPSTA
jgi:ADP-heptose:LPS heptosyltransferase